MHKHNIIFLINHISCFSHFQVTHLQISSTQLIEKENTLQKTLNLIYNKAIPTGILDIAIARRYDLELREPVSKCCRNNWV